MAQMVDPQAQPLADFGWQCEHFAEQVLVAVLECDLVAAAVVGNECEQWYPAPPSWDRVQQHALDCLYVAAHNIIDTEKTFVGHRGRSSFVQSLLPRLM